MAVPLAGMFGFRTVATVGGIVFIPRHLSGLSMNLRRKAAILNRLWIKSKHGRINGCLESSPLDIG